MAHTSRNPERRKTKKRFTISPVSAALREALLLEQAATDYYDSLPADNAAEQAR